MSNARNFTSLKMGIIASILYKYQCQESEKFVSIHETFTNEILVYVIWSKFV
jgi:hypothetical protein